MKGRIRWFFLLVLACAALTAWMVFPGPFAHGLIVGLAIAAGALLLAALLFLRRTGDVRDGLEPPPLPTESWDYGMTAVDLTGRPIDFSTLSDHVVILNFWATWCRPCVAELPSLERLWERVAGAGVHLACVTREDPDVVRSFVEKHEIDVPIYTLRGEVPSCFSSRAIPATYVLDRSGMIALRHVGAAAWDHERVVTFVRGLAARPTT